MNDKHLMPLTVGISCVGNIPGLTCCLSALAAGNAMPEYLNIRLESDFPGIDYYLQQTLCAFKFWGTEVTIQIGKARGIHPTRDEQIKACRTKWLVMLDDDVLPDADLVNVYGAVLRRFSRFSIGEESDDRLTVFVQGTKPDLNNQRGYADFEIGKVPYPPEHERSPAFNFNVPHISKVRLPDPALFDMEKRFCDPGNMMVNVALIRQHGIKFAPFKNMIRRAGGEDTLFAMQCLKLGKLRRFWCPQAYVWHLEKPKATTRLTEHAYRKEALLRSGEQLDVFNADFTVEDFEKALLAWEKVEKHA